MAKKKTTYESSDGKEFVAKAAADKHDAILKAKDEYETARRKLAIALLANEKTADGAPVDICSVTLYCVVNKFYAPALQECHFCWGVWDWGLNDNDRVELYFKVGCGDKERQVIVNLDDLYADVDEARRAVLDARRAIINEKLAELAEAEKAPRQHIQVNY